jgi:hypothetical protein
MDAPTLQPKFLPSRNELGLVAVGFCGGQVSKQKVLDKHRVSNTFDRARLVSMLPPWL